MSQCDAVWDVLKDEKPHSIQAIHSVVGPCRLNSRVAEIREKRGVKIICFRRAHRENGRPVTTYFYQAVPDSLGAPEGNGLTAAFTPSLSGAPSEAVGDLAVSSTGHLPLSELERPRSLDDDNGGDDDAETSEDVAAGAAGSRGSPGAGRPGDRTPLLRGADGAVAGSAASEGSASVSLAQQVSLDDYGVDRAVSELNADFPWMLVEPDRPLSLDENRRRRAELTMTLWGEAA